MPEVIFSDVKATEAIEHIRQKMAVPTKRWDQFLELPRSKAFTIAGATKIDLLNDFQGAVTSAIENGESIGTFRKRFDKIVAEHGWEYNGSRGWRTRVIYDNNLRSAHMAGRWKQIQQVKGRRPYLIYYTVGDDRVRDEHRRWHATVLPVDDAWWDTHYPPNGWGCRCYIVSANDRTLKRRGLTPDKSAPQIKATKRVNHKTGEIYGDVPKGIDVGWDHNVGKQWLASDNAFGEKLVALPSRYRASVLAGVIGPAQKNIQRSFGIWAKDVFADNHGRGNQHTVGWLSSNIIDALAIKNIVPQTAAISITDHRIRRMRRKVKLNNNIALPQRVIAQLPAHLNKPAAILIDPAGALIYVVGYESDQTRGGRFTIQVNFVEKGEMTNSVRSGGLAKLSDLKNAGQYEVLWGEL